MLAEFTFQGIDALGPREFIVSQGLNDVFVHLYRSLRQEAFVHQPQQSLNGAILGMEAVLAMSFKGKKAPGYKFKLFKEGKLVQKGVTDLDGLCGDMKVDLTADEVKPTYRLVVQGPITRRK